MRVCILQCACLDFPLLWSFSLEVWLAVVQSQVLSFYVCVCICYLSGGLLKGSTYNEMLSLLQYVHVFVSSVHLLFQWPDWLSSWVWGPGSLSSHHNGPPPSTGLLYFYCQLTNRLSLSDYSFSVYVCAPQPSCCKYTSPLYSWQRNLSAENTAE